jgi:steroid 5-alpha reductase family enzyme
MRIFLGFLLFFGGAYINIRSDNILLRLRKPGETDYKIPAGFLFRYVSCPNFLGEMIEWSGFAIMAWNVPALSFAVWTVANLAPRALHHHRWYLEKFSEYPKNRKAFIPFLL